MALGCPEGRDLVLPVRLRLTFTGKVFISHCGITPLVAHRSSDSHEDMVNTQRTYDLVLLGATGFTGRLGVEYLHARYSGSPLRWLATGRDPTRLESLRSDLGLDSAQTAICNINDAAALDALVQSTSVIVNFAGTPFFDKAMPVVAACARHGTCYVDISGEVPLHRATYDAYHEQACATGALIVHQCGYDSVPSDLGAFLAVRELRERFGVATQELKSFARKSKGGVSGGTIATALLMMTTSPKKVPGAEAASALGSYALEPKSDLPAATRKDTNDTGGGLIGFDKRAKTWHMPFVMASVNAPVVRKSAVLLGYGGPGARPSYAEVQSMPSRAAALGGTAGLVMLGIALVVSPIRWLLFACGALPKPGEGPSKELQDTGYFHFSTLGVGCRADGEECKVMAHVRSGDAGDPGYKATARMVVEAALCGALERSACAAGGVLTPASAFGMTLAERLRKSGMELSTEVIE